MGRYLSNIDNFNAEFIWLSELFVNISFVVWAQATQPLSTSLFLGFEMDPSLNIAARIRGPNVCLSYVAQMIYVI